MKHKLLVAFTIVSSCCMGNASAEDCGTLKEQATQATGQKKVDLWQQAIKDCTTSDVMYLHYQLGLAFINIKNFSQAKEAFDEANRVKKPNGETEQLGYINTKVATLGRLAQVYFQLEQRPEALLALNSAVKLAKDAQVGIPKWLLDFQKYSDDANSKQPFTAAEIKSLSSASRDFVVEPKLDYQITFEYNMATMTSEGEALLQKVIDSLQQENAPLLRTVIGHTDTKGDAGYNQTLSEKRAATIKKVLIAQFPSLANKLTTQGKGESEPRYLGNTPDDDRRNRRVEFVFSQ